MTSAGPRVLDSKVHTQSRGLLSLPLLAAIVLGLILLSGAFIRLRGLDEAHHSLSIDEARLVLVAQGLRDHHLPVLPSGKVYTRGLPSALVMWPSIAALGTSDFAARLPSVIFGVLVIPVLYLHGMRLGGVIGGLLAAVLAAWYPPFIFWSRQAWFFSLFVLLWSVVLLGLDVAMTSRRPWPLIVAAAATAVGVLTHELFVLLLPTWALALLWLGRNRADIQVGWKGVLAALGIIAGGLTIAAVFTLTHRADTLVGRYGEIQEYLTLNTDLAGFRFYGRLLADRHWMLLAAALIGLAVAGAQRKRLLLLVTAILPLFVVNAFVLPDRPQERYGLALLPPLFVLATAGLWQIRQRMEARFPVMTSAALALALYAGALALHLDPAGAFRRTDVDRGSSDWPSDLRSLGYRDGDLILTDIPTVVYAYLGRTDYWLVSRQFEKYAFEPDGMLRDIHTGGLIVGGPTALEQLVRERHPGETAWVIGSDRSFQWQELVDGDLRRAINDQASLRFQSRDSTRIYRLDL